MAAPVSDPHAPLAVPRRLTTAEEVRIQLARDFPPGALSWVDDLTWREGPQTVPLSQIDRTGPDWALAAKDRAKVASMAVRIRSGHRKPVILVRHPGSSKLFAVDGHSRLLASIALGQPVTAWVGTSKSATGAWRTVHARQGEQPSKDMAGDAPAIDLSAQTARLAVTPAPYGKPGGPGLYGVAGQSHSDYFEAIVGALLRRGKTKAQASAMAWGILRRWAAGGGKVHPEVRAAAAAALAEEASKSGHSHANDAGRVIDLVGPHGYVHGWIKVGDHVRVTHGYGAGQEGHVVQVTDSGIHVRRPDGSISPLKHGYVEPTGKPPIEVAPEAGPSWDRSKVKAGDKVTVGLRQGRVQRLGRRHGIDMALVETEISEAENRYGGMGYAPHWIPLTDLRPPEAAKDAHSHASDGPAIDLAGTWTEALHPRSGGRFASKGGSRVTAARQRHAPQVPAVQRQAPGPGQSRAQQLRYQASQDRHLAGQIMVKVAGLVRQRDALLAGVAPKASKTKSAAAIRAAAARKSSPASAIARAKATAAARAKAATASPVARAAPKASPVARLNGQIRMLRNDARLLIRSANHLDRQANGL